MSAYDKPRYAGKRPKCCRERNGSFSKIFARTGQSGNGLFAAIPHCARLQTFSVPNCTFISDLWTNQKNESELSKELGGRSIKTVRVR